MNEWKALQIEKVTRSTTGGQPNMPFSFFLFFFYKNLINILTQNGTCVSLIYHVIAGELYTFYNFSLLSEKYLNSLNLSL